MNDEIDYRNLKQPPFNYSVQPYHFKSPGYLLLDVPKPVKEEIIESLNNLADNENAATDYRNKLVGHLHKEYTLPITKNLKYLTEKLAEEYVTVFDMEHNTGFTDFYNLNKKYELKSLWVNYQKKHDFNPVHTHSGVFSFVIWIQVPYFIEDEQDRYDPNGNETGMFYFRWITPIGGITAHKIPVDKKWQWKMAYFPAKLNHGVNPFYTSDDYRISVSGNVYVIDKPIDE